MRPLVAFLLLVSCAADAQAQFFPGPVYGPGVPVLVPNGIGFQYRGRRLNVSGFFNTGYSVGVVPVGGFGGPFGPGPLGPIPFGPGPFGPAPFVPVYTLPTAGYVDTRITYQVIAPTVVLAPRRIFGIPAEEADLSGVDLDVAPSPLLLEERKRAPRVELKPKWDLPIEPKPAPDKVVPPKVLPKIGKPKPIEEPSFLDEGKTAFRDGEFALAMFHFRQAAAAEPGNVAPLFYLAQAQIATGKLRDAIATIEAALKLDPDLPLKPYRPKAELFKGAEPEFARQRKVLTDLILEHPKNGVFLFLDGYLDWYEGNRAEARKTFMRARALLADPWFVDRFLKAPDALVRAP